MIEINLLEEKTKRDPLYLYIIFSLLFILLASSAGLFIYAHQMKTSTEKLNHDLVLLEKEELALNDVAGMHESYDAIEKLNQTIEWAERSNMKTVPALKELISRLPETGYFSRYLYKADDSLELLVQFDQTREAAYYLNELQHLEFIDEATLKSVKRMNISENEENDTSVIPRYEAEYTLFLNEEKAKQLHIEASLEEGETE